MTDETRLQVRPKDGESSLDFSKGRSGLVARGRSDSAMLTAPVRAESEEERTSSFPVSGILDLLDGRSTEEVRKDAEKGDAKHQNNLAHRYELGFGIDLGRDLVESARWFRKAADQGYAPAQFNLAWRYDSYLGVPGVGQDYVEAAKWYRMAADQGLSQAQFNLGLKYDNGQGVAQDSAEAATWYLKAADQGFGKAQFNLGLKYNKGQGVVQDYVEAHMWMNLAASDANVDDGKRYAAIRDRVAAKMNPTQIAEAQRLAAHWYREAADQGSIVAQLNLGVMYAFGQGVARDYAEAAKWYRKAADQGFSKAQFNLGLLYEYGEGVVQDYVQAHMWMNLAASQAYSDETYAAIRDRVAAKMNPTQIAEAQRLAREWKTNRLDAR